MDRSGALMIILCELLYHRNHVKIFCHDELILRRSLKKEICVCVFVSHRVRGEEKVCVCGGGVLILSDWLSALFGGVSNTEQEVMVGMTSSLQAHME